MASSDRLRLKDLRAAYRLLAECRELGSDPQAWRLHMLDGLRQLVGARVALTMQLHDIGTEQERITAPLDAGFLEPAGRALWGRYQREKAHRDDPFHLAYYGDFTGLLRTRCLYSVVDARQWQSSRHYNEYVRACGLDDRITSSLRLPSRSPPVIQVIVLHRATEDGRYTRRAQRLVHLFHHELETLIGRQLLLPGAETGGPALPPRLRQVLACLLQGDGEKQIAIRLGISRHTVNRHVQRLYRQFGVQSRGELMYRCRHMLASPLASVDPAGGLLNTGETKHLSS